ncbi:MAG: glycosyltransferase, partial [Anaerolineae bacterium]|nr:glycosyltransferase [Anaerolineae bacterium]
LNQDTYTRRNFEIPAMRTFLLSQYSDDLASLFKEGEEAEFFRSKEEMLDKIAYYLAHDEPRQRIAQRGYERVRDGHDVQSRARQALQTIDRLRAQRRQQHP